VTAAGRTTVLVADDHALARASLRTALETEAAVAVVGEAADGPAAVEGNGRLRPDLVLVQGSLPGLDGVGVCEAVKTSAHPARVIVMGTGSDPRLLRAAFEAGADGYVTSEADLGKLLACVRRVAGGETVVPSRMLGGLLRSLIERNVEADRVLERFMRLTPREQEVLALLVDGCDHEAVGGVLFISPQTARTHIQRLITKLGVHSRLEAATLAVRYGLVDRLPARRA
jgi:DNA-binding NarL/FixJ family response regulator